MTAEMAAAAAAADGGRPDVDRCHDEAGTATGS